MKDLIGLIRLLGTKKRAPAALAPRAVPEAWLFDAAAEAVLIVEASSGRIVEANRAVTVRLQLSRTELLGHSFLECFAGSEQVALQAAMGKAAADSERIVLQCLARNGRDRIRVTLTLVRSGNEAYLLANLGAAADAGRPEPAKPAWSNVLDILQESSEGFLVTDQRLRVSYANRAFAQIVGAESAAALRGEPLSHWVELSVRDLVNLQTQLALRQAVHEFRSILLQGERAQREIEVCAVAVPGDQESCWGFRIREVDPIARAPRGDA
jgi:PAS domain-containing protein